MAYGPGGDFNFLEVGRAAFDLSDRGVGGRPQPGPVDAFLYTERGIYRPGEMVYLTALVRDDKADAMPGLPVDLAAAAAGRGRGRAPPADRRTSSAGYAESFALARDARIGTWRVELKLDPKAPAIGSVEFRVEDFVPPTAQGRAVRRRRAGPPGRAVPGRGRGELLLRRARGRAGGRGAGDDRLRRQPVPERAGLSVRPRRREIHRRPPRSRGAGHRCRRQSRACRSRSPICPT